VRFKKVLNAWWHYLTVCFFYTACRFAITVDSADQRCSVHCRLLQITCVNEEVCWE